jgi:hypothetical protein
MRSKMTKKRAALLAELEYIIGNNCYNGNIQNYGPGGYLQSAGRNFRYPLTLVEEDGTKKKCEYLAAADAAPALLSTGYYAFGANRLHIIKALDELLEHLETTRDFSL